MNEIVELTETDEGQTFIQRLLAFVVWPWQRVQAAAAVCWNWLLMRPWRLFLQGFPALLIGLLLTWIAFYESWGWDAKTVSLYQQLAYRALDQPNLSAVEVYLRKLQQLDVSGGDTQYIGARVAELKGEDDRAKQIMLNLAPEDKSGHPRAHYWVALRKMGEKPRMQTSDVKSLVHHLQEALKSDQDRQSAHITLAQIERSRGNLAESARHLEAVVLDRPEMRLPLCAIYTEMGDTFRARQQRERAIEHFRQKVGRDVNDVTAAVSWSQALMLGDDYAQAEKVLMEVMAKNRELMGDKPEQAKQRQERLAFALGDTYTAWSDHVRKIRDGDVKERLELLQKALQYAPAHAPALNRLAALVDQSTVDGDEVGNLLKEMLANSVVPPAVRMIVGTAAARQQNWEDARQQLEAANRELPQMPVLLNNLAWVLASQEPPHLDQALSYADAAVKVWPKHPEIHETRGSILVRLERWKEALSDLEFALSAFPDRVTLHEKLAQVYEHLGDSELAARHRELAKKK